LGEGPYVEDLPNGSKVLSIWGEDDFARIFYKVNYEDEEVLLTLIRWVTFPEGFKERL
jgi:hypothetical protein